VLRDVGKRPSAVGEALSKYGHFAYEEDSSDADVRIFGVKKNFGFFEIYGVSARTKGESSNCGHFSDKGKGQFFVILCERLLWTALPSKGAANLGEIFLNVISRVNAVKSE